MDKELSEALETINANLKAIHSQQGELLEKMELQYESLRAANNYLLEIKENTRITARNTGNTG